jgi:hypothetical protein
MKPKKRGEKRPFFGGLFEYFSIFCLGFSLWLKNRGVLKNRYFTVVFSAI